MERCKTDLTIFEIARGHGRFQLCMDALTTGLGELSPRQAEVFAEVDVVTLVIVSSATPDERPAGRLLRASEALEEHLIGQLCSSTEGAPKVANFVREGKITGLEQAHLFEHLMLKHLPKVRMYKGPLEARTFVFGSQPAILVSNQFHPAEFRDLTQYIWHLLGRALKRGVYPSVEELTASLALRRLMLTESGAALRLLEKVKIAQAPPR